MWMLGEFMAMAVRMLLKRYCVSIRGRWRVVGIRHICCNCSGYLGPWKGQVCSVMSMACRFGSELKIPARATRLQLAGRKRWVKALISACEATMAFCDSSRSSGSRM